MTLRKDEPGWEEIGLFDHAGRRGLWLRRQPPMPENTLRVDAPIVEQIEVCAGREGDDDYVKLTVGDTLTTHQLAALEGVFTTVQWALELDDVRGQLLALEPVHARWRKATERLRVALSRNISDRDAFAALRMCYLTEQRKRASLQESFDRVSKRALELEDELRRLKEERAVSRRVLALAEELRQLREDDDG